MTDEIIVILFYSLLMIIWLAAKGRTLIKRNSGYLFSIISLVAGTGLLIIGPTFARGWEAIGFTTYGLIITAVSIISFLIVFICEEVKERKGY
jgi:hypothetical protein